MHIHEVIKFILILIFFVGAIWYEERFFSRKVLLIFGVIAIMEGIEKSNASKIVVGCILMVIVFLSEHGSRKIIAIERPHYTKWQIPLWGFLFAFAFYWMRQQKEVESLIGSLLLSLCITWILSIGIKAMLFDMFGWIIILLHKKEFFESRAVIRSIGEPPLNYRNPRRFTYYYEVLSDHRRVEFSKEYEKIFPKTEGCYEYRRDITYKKSNFFNSILITKIR